MKKPLTNKSQIDWFDLSDNSWRAREGWMEVSEMEPPHLVNSIILLEQRIADRRSMFLNLSLRPAAVAYVEKEISDMELMMHNLINELERRNQ